MPPLLYCGSQLYSKGKRLVGETGRKKEERGGETCSNCEHLFCYYLNHEKRDIEKRRKVRRKGRRKVAIIFEKKEREREG